MEIKTQSLIKKYLDFLRKIKFGLVTKLETWLLKFRNITLREKPDTGKMKADKNGEAWEISAGIQIWILQNATKN